MGNMGPDLLARNHSEESRNVFLFYKKHSHGRKNVDLSIR